VLRELQGLASVIINYNNKIMCRLTFSGKPEAVASVRDYLENRGWSMIAIVEFLKKGLP
jgi:hypothetical protein